MSDSRGDAAPRGRQIVGQPSDRQDFIFEKFDGLNTKPLRPGIQDGEMYICDGFFPLGPSNLRTLPDIGNILYFSPNGTTIVWHQGCNLGNTPGMVVLLSDGSVQFIANDTSNISEVLTPGSVQNVSTIFGFRQWSTPVPFLLFAKDQTNGYWVWDGTNSFSAGTISPEVTVTNPGSNYTGQPDFFFVTTGSGSPPSLRADIQNGTIAQLVVTEPGAGFGADDLVAVYISGGGSDQSCIPEAILSGPTTGGVGEVIVVNGGSGFSGATTITSNVPGSSFSPVIQDGVITSVAVINSGQGATGLPVMTYSDPGYPSAGITGGSGVVLVATLQTGQITGINRLQGGSGYTSPPTVTIVGDGTGAQATALIDGTGAVINFQMTNYGAGYSQALVLLSGGNNAASATVQVFPWGISGTTIEVYNDQVWIANGGATAIFPPQNRVIGSAPGFATIFDPTQGAVAFQSNNSQLRVGYHSLIQSNGFLYEIGDSAIDQISGVQTSSANGTATTTFNNINVDPQIGTPWPSSVQLLNRNIVLANPLGIFVSYGGAVTKVSDPLDGIYATGPIFGNTANFSSAVAQIFGRYVYMLLLPIMDQVTKQITQKLLMWDSKRFFTSSQSSFLTFVSTQEINSLMTAWGTNGTSLFPLFTTPGTGFTKTVQSKLWATPGYDSTKLAMHLLGILNFYANDDPVQVSIDSEIGNNNTNPTITISAVEWLNNSEVVATWVNNSNVVVPWTNGESLVVFGPDPVGGFVGKLSGMTLTTNASDVALLSLKLINQITSLTP